LTRQVAVWKQEILTDLLKLLKKYSVIAVADLPKVRSSQIQEIRKKLRGKADLVVGSIEPVQVVGRLGGRNR